MKKIFFLIFNLLIVQFGKTQIAVMFSDDFEDSVKHNKIGMLADGAYNSNAITNKFVSIFYRGGYIDDDIKNQIRDRLKNKNRFGADINYGVYGTFKLDSLYPKKELSFFVAIKNREHFDIRFPKDFYNLTFYGNSPFAGQTLYLNDLNFNLIRYQQLQLGIFSSKLDSTARWGIGVSFLKGEQYMSVHTRKAELYTSEDGQYIDFNSDIFAAFSDTANTGLGAFNGYGAGVDIYFEAPFSGKFGSSKIKASISDVGFIKLNKKTITTHIDSSYHYTGITINDIYELQDSTFNYFNQDSIINGNAEITNKKFSITLPAILNVSFETRFNSRFRLQEGVRYVYNANYSLMAYVKGDIYLTKNILTSATFAYGGYGTFNYGLSVHAILGKHFDIYAGTNNIEGFIVPNKTNGLSGFAALSFVF